MRHESVHLDLNLTLFDILNELSYSAL